MSSSDELPLFSTARSELTVSELTQRIKGVLEPAFGQVWVRGEISNFKPAPSGHVYFSLKDAGATISAAIFGWGARRRAGKAPAVDLKDGLQVLCRGRVTVYPPRGGYQLTVDEIEPIGQGALQIAFERLKAQLAGEGLFAPERKRPLPRFPARIAVITSPTGAAVRDMLQVLGRRAPQIKVLILPTLVQGAEAPAQLVRALQAANRLALGDVIVLARGGGSFEDLFCFNDEALVRAIAASRIPVVSAVGHEIDFTLSDFVADYRAPTPSAAAEVVSAAWLECTQRMVEIRGRLVQAARRDLQSRRRLFSLLSARVISPRDRLRIQVQRCDELSLRLLRAARVPIERAKSGLAALSGRLQALSPLRVLERGYTLVEDPSRPGHVIRSAAEVKGGEILTVRFHDGRKTAQVLP